MSREFIKAGYNSSQIAKAQRQQRYIRSLVVSEVQRDVTENYLEKICKPSYKHTDPLMMWVATIFKNENFQSFFKYTRYPLVSSVLAKEEIEKSLARVFYADDSFKKYIVRGEEIKSPDCMCEDEWAKELFEATLYNYNDLIIHDLEAVNLPYREFLSIEDVVSIKVEGDKIKKVAYRAQMVLPEEEEATDGVIYLDDELMAFYPNDESKPELVLTHDIETCPAVWVSAKAFNEEEPIVRESLFSRVRPLMEKFVFLDTLQIMAETNGAFPVVVKLDTSDETDEVEENQTQDGTGGAMAARPPKGHKEKSPSSIMQAGSVHEVAIPQGPDGSFDTSLITNFANFLRSPVENLEYINAKISSTKAAIVSMVVGDYKEANKGESEAAMNEMQVSKSYISKQDRLRSLSECMSRTKVWSDTIMLRFMFGTDVSTESSFGTDFFIETADDLFKSFKMAPNPIERGHILQRLLRVRSNNRPNKYYRDKVMYALLPFQRTEDFNQAAMAGLVPINEQILQLQFQYILTIFESQYGDVVEFYKTMDEGEQTTEAEIFTVIKSLINQIITDYVNNNQITGLQEGGPE
jgi:hypothetical protein